LCFFFFGSSNARTVFHSLGHPNAPVGRSPSLPLIPAFFQSNWRVTHQQQRVTPAFETSLATLGVEFSLLPVQSVKCGQIHPDRLAVMIPGANSPNASFSFLEPRRRYSNPPQPWSHLPPPTIMGSCLSQLRPITSSFDIPPALKIVASHLFL